MSKAGVAYLGVKDVLAVYGFSIDQNAGLHQGRDDFVRRRDGQGQDQLHRC